jgi:hypothetical protein
MCLTPLHRELCNAAVCWLEGTMRCNVALSGIASTREIPDAIGWSTRNPHYGSIVVECKTTTSDFYADKLKKHQVRMGDFRYFLVPKGLVSVEVLKANYPDHGLLYLTGHGVRVVLHGPRRFDADLHSEIRLLQFAVRHTKDNLLRAGFTVDMNELTKHWMHADCSFLKREQSNDN